MRAKACSWCHDDAGFFHQFHTECHAVCTSSRDPCPDEHRSLAIWKVPADLAEAIAECIPSLLIHLTLLLNAFKRSFECRDRCFLDRKEFYHAVENGELTYPVFVKPESGSASLDIHMAQDQETVEFLCSREDGLMIQEFMNGQEYGADVYIDMLSGEVVSIFVKKKLKMRAGETDKAESFQEKKLFALITDFVKKMGFRGIIDIDLFEIDGNWYISEVNPRFGGGYPHAWACGVRVPEMIVRNLEGQTNVPEIGWEDHDEI